MRIHIHSGENRINLSFPTGLIFNRPAAWLVASILGRYQCDVSPQQLAVLFRALHRSGRDHKNCPLVEIQSADGDEITILL